MLYNYNFKNKKKMEIKQEIEYKSISDESKNNIYQILKEIETNNEINPKRIYNLYQLLKDIEKNCQQSSIISDLFTSNIIYIFRYIFLQEKSLRNIILKIISLNIQIYPFFTNKLLEALYPIAICKIFEEYKKSSFEERYECFKLINIWLKYSDNNFPLIFCQAIASLSRVDDLFKKGCIEFIRNLSIKRPDLCSMVGGFRIMINYLIDTNHNYDDISDNILNSILYVINSPVKRKYFNGFNDLYKIFSVFTKSDFCEEFLTNEKSNSGNINLKKEAEREEEKNKLNSQLLISKKIIKKMLNTWPGFSLIMGDNMSLNSMIQSLNMDINTTIKFSILQLIKEILEEEYNYIDNFIILSSETKDDFYPNKIYFAFILQNLQENNLFETLIKFINEDNNNLTNNSNSDFAYKLALKYNILYNKLSNNEPELPFLSEKQKIFDEMNLDMNYINQGINIENNINQESNTYNELNEDLANMKIKMMHLLDQTFYHFNCKDNSLINIDTISSDVIMAMNSYLYIQNIKKYDKQYYIDTCKKELFSKDEESYNQILKNSKILDSKEFQNIDWKYIDTLLDIIETRKELIIDLHKNKFFRKILYNLMPSKNLIINQFWSFNNFIYMTISNKMFKFLSNYSDISTILDSLPEDYIIKKGLTWLEDVMQCLINILPVNNNNQNLQNANRNRDKPFEIKKVYQSLSKSIFSFIGILSQTSKGDEFLFKRNFYILLDNFVSKSNKYDYLLTNLIDNLDFNSNNVSKWIFKLIKEGSSKIKRYIFDHLRCLLKFGKDIKKYVEIMIESLNKENEECNEVIIDILKTMILDGIYLEVLNKNKNLIEKAKEIDKSLLYILMRNQKSFDFMTDFIDSELNNLDINDIIENYAKELKNNMMELYENKEISEEKYYLNINLHKIESMYDLYNEFYFLKQLPFNILISTVSSKNPEKKEDIILITYMEYHKNNNIELCGIPLQKDEIIIVPKKQNIIIKIALGKFIVNNKTCNINNNNNEIIFNSNDMYELIKDIDNKNEINQDKKEVYIINKNGVYLYFKLNFGTFRLIKVIIKVKINPGLVKSIKMPINIITELNNNKNGYEKLVKNKIIDELLSYLDLNLLESKNIQIKSVLWILARLIIKETQGEILENKYQIIKRIIEFNQDCEDYAMKGTIIYILCYISQNKNIKNIIESYNYTFFFNTDICYPNNNREIYIDNKPNYLNNKINEEVEKISKLIKMPPPSEEIYNNISNLINNISFKQAISELEETYKNNPQKFYEINLFIKIYVALSKYKFKPSARKSILNYFDKAINSNDFAQEANKILNEAGYNILTAHAFEE